MVAACDIDLGRAKALAQELPGDVVATASAESALAADGVDLAFISTIHSALAPLTVLALEAGCHVFVEKPGVHRLDALARGSRRRTAQKPTRAGRVQPPVPPRS